MHRLKLFLVSFLMASLSLACGLATAQQPKTQTAQPSAVTKNKPTEKSVKKSQTAKAAKAATVKPPAEEPLPAHELSIAEKVHVGHLPCELGASVRMTADDRTPGYFNLQGKGYKYRMRPVTTSTGAIRLEDEKAGAVWLQLANKSMLMDQKNGRRLADECAHPDQVAFANDMKINPPPALIDVSNAATPTQR